ncbi:MAG: cation diffusion facilitator family transporter [Anaerolineales bacterium]|jgi:cation diffusion facilitator family transporter
MAGGSSDKPITIYAAITANFLIAVSKFIVAGITGSSAMLSEGIHSVADTGNQALLLLGIRLSRRDPSEEHPFGHGKELYFWSLIVAIVLFGVGGGISLYEGLLHLQHPVALGDPTWNYVVLGIAAVFETGAFYIAFRELVKVSGDDSVWQAVRESKDPTIFVVLFEDAAALAGLIVAFLGVFLGHQLQMPLLDALASIVIAVILMSVAVLLAYESRNLLIGEAASPEVVASIRSLVAADKDIAEVMVPVTMHLGPKEILLNMDLRFRKGLRTGEIAAAIDRIENNIRKAHPQIKHIYLEVEALREA